MSEGGPGWTEVRCKRVRGGQECGNLIGYTAILDGYVALWCRKCDAWAIIGSASFLPEKLPRVKSVEQST